MTDTRDDFRAPGLTPVPPASTPRDAPALAPAEAGRHRERIELYRVGRVPVLRLVGPSDPELLSILCDTLDALRAPVIVIDFTDVTLCELDIIHDLVTLLSIESRDKYLLVSRRGSSRAVLRAVGRWKLPMYPSVPDAIYASRRRAV